MRAGLEAQIDGVRARLTIPSLGLAASASVRDVELVMLETVEASPGVLPVAGTNVLVRSVGARMAVVEVRGLHVSLGCLRGEAGVRSHVLGTPATLVTRPAGAVLVELPAGTSVLLGAPRRGHVAVIEALGVQRIPSDCDRGEPTGIGWIATDAL